MYGPPLFAVDFNSAIYLLEHERETKRMQRVWANVVVIVIILVLLVFGTTYLSYNHNLLALMGTALFGFLMDRINSLHVNYIERQINLLICIEQRGSVSVRCSRNCSARPHPMRKSAP
ncbi:hypothetical protein SAMN05421772_110154 [Paracoccus saliphilus]|uniref:Uncharacterized protein n=1 Tax=Paracoccus saliphilus TaxID=405559 RepID=A0AA45W604_9RHOB|nr:hypothetical protein SAMN05421772_110154 [Paracoccus saliphilus]